MSCLLTTVAATGLGHVHAVSSGPRRSMKCKGTGFASVGPRIQAGRSAQPSRAPQLRNTRGDLQRASAAKQKFSSFDDMIQGSDTPLLVDFYATWCGPCQMASTELETFSAIMDGAVKVVKIDTDKYPSISTRHSVQGLPTLVLFNKGKELYRMEGFLPAMQLADRVRYYLAK